MKISIGQPLYCNEVGRRPNNEDNIYPRPSLATDSDRLFLVCDGMGGHAKGEIASEMVSRAMADYWIVNSELPDTEEKVNNALEETVRKLNEIDNGEEEKKMGTTLTLASIDTDQIMVAHVGDSRIYLVRPGKGIVFHTRDHSLVQKWVDSGILTLEEARVHPKKNVISRAVQPGEPGKVKADVIILTDVESGDYLFMCTDGVTEAIDDQELIGILSQDTSDPVKMATIRERCGEQSKDNFSAYLIPLIVEKDEKDKYRDVARSTDDLLSPADRCDLRNLDIERQVQAHLEEKEQENVPGEEDHLIQELVKSFHLFLASVKDCLRQRKNVKE